MMCAADLVLRGVTTRWAEHVARVGEERNACRVLVGKPEGKRPLYFHSASLRCATFVWIVV